MPGTDGALSMSSQNKLSFVSVLHREKKKASEKHFNANIAGVSDSISLLLVNWFNSLLVLAPHLCADKSSVLLRGSSVIFGMAQRWAHGSGPGRMSKRELLAKSAGIL